MDHEPRTDQRQLWKRHLLKMRRQEERRLAGVRFLSRHRPLPDVRRSRSDRGAVRAAPSFNPYRKSLLTANRTSVGAADSDSPYRSPDKL